MELKIFFTKQHFRRHFQWLERVQTWRRLRLGQLVIEARRIGKSEEEKEYPTGALWTPQGRTFNGTTGAISMPDIKEWDVYTALILAAQRKLVTIERC